MPDWKALYIAAIKKCDDDIYRKCTHYHECEAEECRDYESGTAGYINGSNANFHWTCMDFNYGTCPVLENTPCNGCVDNDFSGFELKEDAIS